jgi:hypothetical protein
VKLEVISGQVRHNGVKYAVGETLDASGDEAKRLISLGIVKQKTGKAATAEDSSTIITTGTTKEDDAK